MLKFKIHSIVDVITNSPTVIFTYQNSVSQAKELVDEVLKLSGSDKAPDDVFYYGVFCDADEYIESLDELSQEELPDGLPKHNDWKEEGRLQKEWLNGIIEQIMKGEMEEPEWMENAATNYDDYHYSTYLYLIPKDDKYNELAEKIKKLLGSVSGDGYRDG